MRKRFTIPGFQAILFAVTAAMLAACGGQSDSRAASAQNADGSARLTLSNSDSLVIVYKSPTCGCCTGWVEHMQEQGFKVEVHDVSDLNAIKRQFAVPSDLESCHTALHGGYVIEGHVPAEDIRRLLAERPAIAGIAAPGMPVGSPGMEVPGRAADRYDVVAFDKSGGRSTFASH